MNFKTGNKFSYEDEKLSITEGYIKDVYNGTVEIYFDPWSISTKGDYIYKGTGKAKIGVDTFNNKAALIAEQITPAERDTIQNARVAYIKAKDDLAFIATMLESCKRYDLIPEDFVRDAVQSTAPYKTTQDAIDTYTETLYKVFAE